MVTNEMADIAMNADKAPPIVVTCRAVNRVVTRQDHGKYAREQGGGTL